MKRNKKLHLLSPDSLYRQELLQYMKKDQKVGKKNQKPNKPTEKNAQYIYTTPANNKIYKMFMFSHHPTEHTPKNLSYRVFSTFFQSPALFAQP